MFDFFKGAGAPPEGGPAVYPVRSGGGLPKKLPRYLLIGLLAALVVAVAATCWYTVDDKQQAVVTTFGKVTDVTDAGLHFKLPLGIQQVEKVDVNVYQKLELGYRSTGGDADSFDIIDS